MVLEPQEEEAIEVLQRKATGANFYYIRIKRDHYAAADEFQKTLSRNNRMECNIFRQGTDGERYLNPSGIREISRKWGKRAEVPVEPSTTGAAASCSLTWEEIERSCPGFTNQQLKERLQKFVIPYWKKNFKRYALDLDFIPTFSLSWNKLPASAMNWERRSQSGWPDQALIEKVRTVGPRFAAKTSKEEGHLDRDFRMGFSPEVLLGAYKHARRVLIVMKDLNKVYIKTTADGLKSFQIKMAILWKREEFGERVPEAHEMIVKVLEFLYECYENRMLPNYFDEETNLLIDMKPDEAELIKTRIYNIQQNLVKYIRELDRVPPASSMFFYDWLKFIYSIPIDGAAAKEDTSDDDDDDDNPFGFNSIWNPTSRDTRKNAIAKGVQALIGTVITGEGRPTRKVEKGIKSGLDSFLHALVVDSVQDSLPKLHGDMPEWMRHLEESLQDREKPVPRVPSKEVAKFLVFQFIPWLGFQLHFEIV